MLMWTGKWRADWVQNYRATSAPAWRRNAAFAALPVGLSLGAGGVAALLPHSWFGVTALLSSVFLFCCPLALLIVFMEPTWAKPAWVRELDESDWQGFQPTGKRIGRVLKTLTLFDALALVVALVHRSTIWDFIA